jgi:uncharacterized glyoxalase superfamily protein PhnB
MAKMNSPFTWLRWERKNKTNKKPFEEFIMSQLQALSLNILRHTRNYERMLYFYQEQLGLAIVESWDEPGNRGTIFAPFGVPAEDNSEPVTLIELLDMSFEVVPKVSPANVMLSLQVPDAATWLEQLQEAGVMIARELEETTWNRRSFGIDDPDGLRIWFYQLLPARQ